ncbi:MAG: TolC family protein [Verrucomicrobiota bacterium]
MGAILCLVASCLTQGLAQRLPVPEAPTASEAKPIYTLVDCINIALRKNPDVQVALKKIEEAEGLRIEARAGFLPSLTSSATYLHREADYATQDGSDPLRRQEDWNINVRVTQNVYSGGGNTGRFAISKLKKEQRLLEYRAAIDEMVMHVRLAFYEVLLNDASIRVRQQAVEMLKQEMENQTAKFQAGTVPRLNVMRAEVNLANEMPALIEAENNYKNALLRLSELMAVPYSTEADEVPFTIQGNLDYQKAEFSLNDCLSKAEATRPELKVKELGIQIEEKQMTVDRSEIIPRLDLFAGYDYLNETSSSAKNDTVGGYVAGISGTWHAFDGLATSGRLKATRARLASAYLMRDATRTSIQTDVRTAFLKLQQAESTLVSQAENSTLARESFLLSKASFDAGLSSQLDIMQSRVDLTRAQTNELKARFDHKVAMAQLQHAISNEFRIIEDTPQENISQHPEEDGEKLFQNTNPLPLREEKKNPAQKTPLPKPAFRVSYRWPVPGLRPEETETLAESSPEASPVFLRPSLAYLREAEEY